jgi:hypothetical protein
VRSRGLVSKSTRDSAQPSTEFVRGALSIDQNRWRCSATSNKDMMRRLKGAVDLVNERVQARGRT